MSSNRALVVLGKKRIIVETPLVCTRLQARLALGPELCAQVDAMASDESVDWATRQMIQFATVWERDMPEIDQLGALLGLSSEQIDSLFTEAMTK